MPTGSPRAHGAHGADRDDGNDGVYRACGTDGAHGAHGACGTDGAHGAHRARGAYGTQSGPGSSIDDGECCTCRAGRIHGKLGESIVAAVARLTRLQLVSHQRDKLCCGGVAVFSQEVRSVKADAGFFADEVVAEAGPEGTLDEEHACACVCCRRGYLSVGRVDHACSVDHFA
jgi:hypothetical protein